jgi:hypothetical protein
MPKFQVHTINEVEHRVYLGDIYVGRPTCADDLALLSSSEDETQLMLNVVHRYSQAQVGVPT